MQVLLPQHVPVQVGSCAGQVVDEPVQKAAARQLLGSALVHFTFEPAGPCAGQVAELPVQKDVAKQPVALAHTVEPLAYCGTQLPLGQLYEETQVVGDGQEPHTPPVPHADVEVPATQVPLDDAEQQPLRHGWLALHEVVHLCVVVSQA